MLLLISLFPSLSGTPCTTAFHFCLYSTLTLYDGDIGSSPSLKLTTDDSSLDDNDWDNRTSSVVVSGECQWILYDLADFEENDAIPSVIGPGNYPFNFSNNETTFGLPDNVLSAVRCLPAEGRPAVVLFQHHWYFGEMQVISSSISSLSLINLDNTVSSLVITGGMWEFYSEANYTGLNITLGQGLYPNAHLTPIENELTSVRLTGKKKCNKYEQLRVRVSTHIVRYSTMVAIEEEPQQAAVNMLAWTLKCSIA